MVAPSRLERAGASVTAIAALAFAPMAPAQETSGGPPHTIAVTADAVARPGSCAECPGGALELARRLTGLAKETGALDPIDAGGAFAIVEPDAARRLERVEALADAYAGAEYRVVHIVPDDLGDAPVETARALTARLPGAVSSNVRIDGALLFPAGAVVERDGRRLGVVGVSAPPRARDVAQGVTVAPPVAAVLEALDGLRGRVDRVLVLHHGGGPSLERLIDALGEGLDPPVVAIVAAGLGRRSMPPSGAIPCVSAAGAAAGLRLLRVGDEGLVALSGRPSLVDVEPSVEVTSLLAAALPTADPATLELARRVDAGTGAGIGLRVAGHRIEAPGGQGPRTATLVVDAEFENCIPFEVAFDPSRESGERVGVTFRQKLFAVLCFEAGEPALVVPADPALRSDDALPTRFELSTIGARARGAIAFEMPPAALEAAASVELQLYHDEFGASLASVIGEPAPPRAFDPSASNDYIALESPGLRFPATVEGEGPPRGTRWLELSLTGRSTRATGEPAPYLEAATHLTVVADGQWACPRAEDAGTLAAEPTFLPNVTSGGQALFLVPAEARSLVLEAAFPLLQNGAGAGVDLDPETLVLPLEGEAAPVPAEPAHVVVDDDPVDLAIVGALGVEGPFAGFVPAGDEELVLVDCRLQSDGAEDGLLELRGRLLGQGIEGLATFGPGEAPVPDTLLVPAGARRAVRVLLSVPAGTVTAGTLSMRYAGIATNVAFDVPIGVPAASDAELVPPVEIVAAGEPAPTREAGPVSDGLEPKVAPPAIAFDDLPRSAANAAVRCEVLAARLSPELDGGRAPEGQTFLVLDTHWTNLRAGRPEADAEPEPWSAAVADQLHLVVDGRRVAPRRRRSDAFAADVQVPPRAERDAWRAKHRRADADLGPPPRTTTGILAYVVPASGLASLELHLLDPDDGNFEIVIAGRRPASEPAVPAIANRVAHVAPHAWSLEPDERDSNVSVLTVDLRGRSLRLADPGEHRGRAEPRDHLPLDWDEGRLHALVGGVHATGPATIDLVRPHRWLPTAEVGGLVTFRLPRALVERSEGVELVLGMDEIPVPGEAILRPETLVFSLVQGGRPECADAEAMWSIDDGGLVVEALSFGAASVAGVDCDVARLRVRNGRDVGAWFDASKALSLRAPDGESIEIERSLVQRVERPWVARGRLWLPPGSTRVFDIPYEPANSAAVARYAGLLRHVDVALVPGAAPEAPPMPRIADVAALDRARESLGIAGVGLDGAEVNRAIDAGCRWLWSELAADAQRGGRLGTRTYHVPMTLALVHAGEHLRNPAFDRALRDYLDVVRPTTIGSKSTYKNGMLAMTIASYGDSAYLPLLRDVARYLVEDQNGRGVWNYGTATPERYFELAVPDATGDEGDARDRGPLTVEGEPPARELAAPSDGAANAVMRRQQDWSVNGPGDNSVTQYAVLGLLACERAGVAIDPDVWRRLLAEMWSRRNAAGSWGYTNGRPYGSMACAGTSIAVIAMRALEPDRDPTDDSRIRDALAWLAENWAVGQNPDGTDGGRGEFVYYHAYGVERVGRLLDVDAFGPHEWYPPFAKWLVDAQASNGSWPGVASEPARLATPFALLFLTRATETLDPVRRAEELARARTRAPRAGSLEMDAQAAEARCVVFVLDASGSMLSPPGGEAARRGAGPKFELARAAIAESVARLPEASSVGLVVYGHRKRAREDGADEDVEVVLPVQPLDRARFTEGLLALRARGKTPLALSLDAAVRAARESGSDEATIVLLTDGGQGREPGDPVESAERVRRAGFSLEIIGFDVDEARSRTAAAWTSQLTAMAEAAQGRLRVVGEETDLTSAVAAASTARPESFELVDAQGATVASGPFGGRVELEPGTYRFRATYAGTTHECEVRIGRGRTTRITFDASGIRPPEGD